MWGCIAVSCAAMPEELSVCWWSEFPVWAWQRLDPSLQGRELLVVAAGQVVSLTPALRQVGVRPGFRQERALALAPEALVRQASGIPEKLLWEEVLLACNRHTPWLEGERPGRLTARLRGPELDSLARELGCRAGRAGDHSTAYLAALASRPGQPLAVPAGAEEAFRDSLPLALLGRAGVCGDSLQKLVWLGFSSVGSLLRLTRAQLLARLAEGELLYELSRWEDRRPLRLFVPPPELEAGWSDEQELEQLEPVLGHLLDQLLARLAPRRAACVTVEVGSARVRRYLQSPSGRRGPLWNAAARAGQEALAAYGMPPGEVRLRLGGLSLPPSQQGRLFAPDRRSLRPAGLEKALARLEARLPGRLFRVRTLNPDAYLPEEACALEPLHA